MELRQINRDEKCLCPATNGWNVIPCAAACHAAATEPIATGSGLRAANAEVPGRFKFLDERGGGGSGRRGCPNCGQYGIYHNLRSQWDDNLDL